MKKACKGSWGGRSKRESKKNDVQNLNHGKGKGKIERMRRGRGRGA